MDADKNWLEFLDTDIKEMSIQITGGSIREDFEHLWDFRRYDEWAGDLTIPKDTIDFERVNGS